MSGNIVLDERPQGRSNRDSDWAMIRHMQMSAWLSRRAPSVTPLKPGVVTSEPET